MGIIVSDEYTNDYGFVTNERYVNIDNIHIKKAHLNDYKYNIWVDRNVYASQQARNENKRPLETNQLLLLSNTVNEIHNQAYTAIKERYQYQNYTDDI